MKLPNNGKDRALTGNLLSADEKSSTRNGQYLIELFPQRGPMKTRCLKKTHCCHKLAEWLLIQLTEHRDVKLVPT